MADEDFDTPRDYQKSGVREDRFTETGEGLQILRPGKGIVDKRSLTPDDRSDGRKVRSAKGEE